MIVSPTEIASAAVTAEKRESLEYSNKLSADMLMPLKLTPVSTKATAAATATTLLWKPIESAKSKSQSHLSLPALQLLNNTPSLRLGS